VEVSSLIALIVAGFVVIVVGEEEEIAWILFNVLACDEKRATEIPDELSIFLLVWTEFGKTDSVETPKGDLTL